MFVGKFYALAALGIGVALSGQASAQSYPSKPIRFINPFGAGGLLDAVLAATRIPLETRLKQPIHLVEWRNHPDWRPKGHPTGRIVWAARQVPPSPNQGQWTAADVHALFWATPVGDTAETSETGHQPLRHRPQRRDPGI